MVNILVVYETKPYDLLRLVTVTVEEDQINTPTCSPGAFIQQYQAAKFEWQDFYEKL